MYTVFGASPTLRALLAAYAVLIFGLGTLFEPPSSLLTGVRWALLSSGLFLGVSTVLAGWSGFFSPWRVAFRLWRQLNEWFYPDLNGVWYGNTKSNWGVIETKRVAAATRGGLSLGDLPSVPLKEGEIAIEIKADLFRVQIRSRVSDTNGSSVSLSSRAEKTQGEYRLSYLYRQETPEPAHSDEGTHDGAATLVIAIANKLKMSGVYWTRRKWREGMNTAGMIEITRVSAIHAPSGVDLLEHARLLSRQS